MADLVTLPEVKTALGIPTGDTDSDAKLTQAITTASSAIRDYTEREFVTPVSSSSTRTYAYDGSGVLEIDDADSVSAVTLDSVALQSTEYSVEPYGHKPFTWLFLPERKRAISPAMGFTYNLDRLWWRVLNQAQTVAVTATWGWAAIPDAVKQASIWTAVAFSESPRPFISERVADVSRTYANPLTGAIPTRAKELLDPYIRGSK